MDLLLHIGTEKTGTTTLQSWCVANRAALRAQGVWFPRSISGDHGNCRALAVAARDADRFEDGFRIWGIATPADHAQFVADLKQAFDLEASEARRSGARAMLITSEHLQSRLPTEVMVQRVRTFLGDHFGRIQVLAHLRPQIDMAVSAASTAARVGKPIGAAFFDHIRPGDPYYHYDRLISRWEAVFGVDAVRLLAFRRQPCVTTEIIKLLSLDPAQLGPIQRRNEALDVWAIALMNAVNLPRYDAAGALDPNRELFLEDIPVLERLSPGRDVAQAVSRRFLTSNAALGARRTDISADDLTPDLDRYDAQGNLEALAALESAGPILRAVIRRLNAALHVERARAVLAECERALGAGNFADATADLAAARAEITAANQAETGALAAHEAGRAARLAQILQRLGP